jgi:hypothetical protein
VVLVNLWPGINAKTPVPLRKQLFFIVFAVPRKEAHRCGVLCGKKASTGSKKAGLKKGLFSFCSSGKYRAALRKHIKCLSSYREKIMCTPVLEMMA